LIEFNINRLTVISVVHGLYTYVVSIINTCVMDGLVPMLAALYRIYKTRLTGRAGGSHDDIMI
jgi:hypothetical protein